MVIPKQQEGFTEWSGGRLTIRFRLIAILLAQAASETMCLRTPIQHRNFPGR